VEAMLSKIILTMPKTQVKNQESSKFQESKIRSIKASFKNQRVVQSKQVSKNQRVVQSRIKIQEKNQEKTQDMQEPLR